MKKLSSKFLFLSIVLSLVIPMHGFSQKKDDPKKELERIQKVMTLLGTIEGLDPGDKTAKDSATVLSQIIGPDDTFATPYLMDFLNPKDGITTGPDIFYVTMNFYATLNHLGISLGKTISRKNIPQLIAWAIEIENRRVKSKKSASNSLMGGLLYALAESQDPRAIRYVIERLDGEFDQFASKALERAITPNAVVALADTLGQELSKPDFGSKGSYDGKNRSIRDRWLVYNSVKSIGSICARAGADESLIKACAEAFPVLIKDLEISWGHLSLSIDALVAICKVAASKFEEVKKGCKGKVLTTIKESDFFWKKSKDEYLSDLQFLLVEEEGALIELSKNQCTNPKLAELLLELKKALRDTEGDIDEMIKELCKGKKANQAVVSGRLESVGDSLLENFQKYGELYQRYHQQRSKGARSTTAKGEK